MVALVHLLFVLMIRIASSELSLEKESQLCDRKMHHP